MKKIRIKNLPFKKIKTRENKCQCGDTITYTNQTSVSCTYPCSGNFAEYCGDSGQYCNVYTSISNYIQEQIIIKKI